MSASKTAFFLLVFFVIGTSAYAQTTSLSLGPQIGGFGIGASASARVGEYVSLSAELGFLPLGTLNNEIDDIDYVMDPEIFGAVLGVHIHPFRGNISVGAGIVFGKYLLDVESDEFTGTVEVGDVEYTSSEVGTMIGEFTLEGTWPAVMLGWRGKGVNFGLGVAFIKDPVIDIRATGPIASDPFFQAELEQEIDDIQDDLKIGVLPIFRFGYQFGIGSK